MTHIAFYDDINDIILHVKSRIFTPIFYRKLMVVSIQKEKNIRIL